MKHISLIFNIVLSIAVVVLFILHFTSKPAVPETIVVESGEFVGKGEIVFIHIDSLVNQYDKFNDLSSELESKAQAIQDDLNRRQRTFENEVKDFNDRYSKGLLTSSNANALQQQLSAKEQELINYAQQKQAEIMEEEDVLYRIVLDAIKTYLAGMNIEKQYSLILNTSSTTNIVLEGDHRLNITNSVLKGMNEEYIRERARR